MTDRELNADVAVIGAGLGGIAAALAAARSGQRVILTEEAPWIGGQMTSQAVGHCDDHPWIEQFGCTPTYRQLRENIRDYYRRWFPLTAEARAQRYLSPGAGTASALHFEPRAALTSLWGMLQPHLSAGTIQLLEQHAPTEAAAANDAVQAVAVRDRLSGDTRWIHARYYIDATEQGQLLPLTGTEYVTGAEPQSDTGEPHAPAVANPLDLQAITWCFVMDHVPGADFTVPKPAMYETWKQTRDQEWPNGPLSWTVANWIDRSPLTYTFEPNPDTAPTETSVKLSTAEDTVDQYLWLFRRMIARKNFVPGTFASDITLVNWGMNDYFAGAVVELPDDQVAANLDAARQLSLSLLHWMQTEAPRPDGEAGYPGLRLRGDVTGTDDGLAQRPYIREGRRIRAVTRVVEQDLNAHVRGDLGAVRYRDTIGIGSYRLDLHPSSNGGRSMEIPALPYHIPLGALLPQRVTNLMAGAKNIGTTHITNGCYRLHHAEWNIGEVAGLLAAHCLATGRAPRQVQEADRELTDFQALLVREGIELAWPAVGAY